MGKSLFAIFLLLTGLCWSAPPPPDTTGEHGDWGNVTVQNLTTLKVFVRGQRLSLSAYATSIGDEFLVPADSPELQRIVSLFGGRLQWDEEAITLHCIHKGIDRTLKLDERKVQGPPGQAGAQEAELPVAAQVLDDKGCIPLSALEEFLQTRVTVKPNQQVYIEPLLRAVRFEGSPAQPRLVLETTAPVKLRCFTLKSPRRYVIDVRGAVIDTPALTVQHPDLGTIRLGQFELGPAISRVVVPIPEGVRIQPESSFNLAARESFAWQMQLPPSLVQTPREIGNIEEVRLEKSEKGHRLILQSNQPIRYEWLRLGGANPRWLLDIPSAHLKNPRQEYEIGGRFSGSVRLSQNQPDPYPLVRVVVDLNTAVEVSTSVGDNDKQLVIEVQEKELDLATAVLRGRGSTSQSAPMGGGVIVIDPGHGGSDCGALNKSLGISEAEITLDTCKRLAQILKSLGWTVIMTRTSDVDVSFSGSSASEELGARAKVANEARADLFLSVHCNASSNPNSNGTSLHYYKQSDYLLASELQAAVLASTGRANRGLQANRFYVLTHTQMPAVLVETAFLTNASEGALLADPAYRQRIAEGLALGLRRYAASRLVNFGTASK